MSKEIKSDRTRIYEYTPPPLPIKVLVTPLIGCFLHSQKYVEQRDSLTSREKQLCLLVSILDIFAAVINDDCHPQVVQL